MMLRREVDVMDDMRRIRREAREPFLSSGEEGLFSSGLEREDKDSRLAGRETGVACRLDPADEIDMLRVSERRGSSAGGLWDCGSLDSCSTVNGLAWSFRASDSVGSVLGETLSSRKMCAVTETEFVRRTTLGVGRASWRLKLGARENPPGIDKSCFDTDGASGLSLGKETDARLQRLSNDEDADAPAMELPGGVGVPSRLENFSSALIRLEMPDDTLIFLAMRTGVGGSLSGYELDTDRPTDSACIAEGDGSLCGLDTAREPCHESPPLGDFTETGRASRTVADRSSSINESSERRLSSSEYSGVGT